MSARKSKARKIIRQVERDARKKEVARQRVLREGRIAGETEEQEEARKVRDLTNWLGMMTEREVEEAVLTAAENSTEELEDGVRQDGDDGEGPLADAAGGVREQPEESEGDSVPGPLAEG